MGFRLGQSKMYYPNSQEGHGMRLSLYGVLSLLFLSLPAVLGAQQPEPLRISGIEVEDHRLREPAKAHFTPTEIEKALKSGEYTGYKFVPVQLTVGANGHVESADVSGVDTAAAGRIRSLEMTETFKPWYQDGRPIRVSFLDGISILGPEPLKNKSFPRQVDLSQVTISLEHRGHVTIFGDGTVLIHADPEALRGGEHVARVSPDIIRALVEQFRKADFFSLKDEYIFGATDLSPNFLVLKIGSQTKQIMDMDPPLSKMPKAVRDLEDQIDAIADTEHLVRDLPFIGVSSSLLPEEVKPATTTISDKPLQPWTPAARQFPAR
jgi:hypothetical protein